MRYGLPYQGSKNDIAQWVIDHLPPADVLIDAFAGGCAITHCAMLSHKFKRVIANDINDIPSLFMDAIRGKYRNETRWISREDFFALKDTDPYVRVCWSFSNSGDAYLYGLYLERYKKAYHYAAVFQDYTLFEDMGIDIPQWLRDKAKKEEGMYDRKLTLHYYISQHNDEIAERVKVCFLQYIEEKKERWQEMIGEVIDTKKIKAEEEKLRGYLLQALKESGLTQSEVNRRLGTQMSGHYFGRSQWYFPTYEEYTKMQAFMPLKEDYYEVTKFYTILKTLQALEDLQNLQALEDLQNLEQLQSLEGLERLQSLEGLERLQSLEGLERLQSLERLEQKENHERLASFLETRQGDFSEIPLPKGESFVIYCDPPYYGTNCGAYSGFDHERFYEWLRSLSVPVVVSEYSMPSDFVLIDECTKQIKSDKKGQHKGAERLFCHESTIDKLPKTTLF